MPFIISKNLYHTDKEQILKEFENNSKNLKFRNNDVYLYHEIISLTQQKSNLTKKAKRNIKQLLINILKKEQIYNLHSAQCISKKTICIVI